MQAPGIGPAATLAEEHAAAHTLLALLKNEQAHLVEADVEGLTRLTEEKARLAAHMSALAKRRHQALSAAGFPSSESGMQAWLNGDGGTAADSEAWYALLALALSGKEQNRVNGLLISQHMARNQSALSVLQGNAQGGNFYGPNGQSTTKIGSRRLVVG